MGDATTNGGVRIQGDRDGCGYMSAVAGCGTTRPLDATIESANDVERFSARPRFLWCTVREEASAVFLSTVATKIGLNGTYARNPMLVNESKPAHCF